MVKTDAEKQLLAANRELHRMVKALMRQYGKSRGGVLDIRAALIRDTRRKRPEIKKSEAEGFVDTLLSGFTKK